MLVRTGFRRFEAASIPTPLQNGRRYSSNGPSRLSKIYVPTSKVVLRQAPDGLKSVHYLVKAGFIRQSSSGIYTLLPYAQRVIDKLDAIISEEMYSIGASRLSLPNLLPPDLWKQSGRWQSTGAELWRLEDRRGSEMLLAPTHEEEITALVASDVVSERSLPVKLFQIGRKFRDEARPRAGLLRGREFIMKDLYTFDANEQDAMQSYEDAKAAYCRIFERIGVPYAVADADTGNIGGSSSHEFHYLSEAGEDTLMRCASCGYTANSELARSSAMAPTEILEEDDCAVHLFDLPSTKRLVAVITRKDRQVNPIKLRAFDAEPTSTTSSKVLDGWDSLTILLDETCITLDGHAMEDLVKHALGAEPRTVWPAPPGYEVGDYRVAEAGERCTKCKGTLEGKTAIEVGHTFLLGTKYSKALNATFARLNDPSQARHPFQMGCYGIGVTRLLGSIAEYCSDERGLRWPASVAPFRVCVISTDPGHVENVLTRLAPLSNEVVLDDRFGLSFGTRIRDAELIGYPCIVIVGKTYQQTGKVEIQNRWTGERVATSLNDALDRVEAILSQSVQQR